MRIWGRERGGCRLGQQQYLVQAPHSYSMHTPTPRLTCSRPSASCICGPCHCPSPCAGFLTAKAERPRPSACTTSNDFQLPVDLVVTFVFRFISWMEWVVGSLLADFASFTCLYLFKGLGGGRELAESEEGWS